MFIIFDVNSVSDLFNALCDILLYKIYVKNTSLFIILLDIYLKTHETALQWVIPEKIHTPPTDGERF